MAKNSEGQPVETRRLTDAEAKNRSAGIGCAVLITLVAGLAYCTSGSAEADPSVQAANVAAWDKAITQTVAGCDAASRDLSSALSEASKGRGSAVDHYRAAKLAQDVCSDSWYAVKRIRTPDGLNDEDSDDAEKAQKICADAYFLRREAAEKLAAIFNGDASPATLAAAQDATNASAGGMLSCSRNVGILLKRFPAPKSSDAR